MRKFLITLLLTVSVSSWSITKPGARWWWLGSALNKADVTWNMEQYASHGIGALEITPLYGVQGNAANNIDYLSPKWMDMYKHVLSEGKRLGIQIDMNNGTGWPFGGPATDIKDAACKVVIVDTIVTSKDIKKGLLPTLPEKERKWCDFSFATAYPLNKEGKPLNASLKMKGDDLPYVYNNYALDMTPYVKGESWTLTWSDVPSGAYRVVMVFNSRTRQQVKRAAPGGQGYVIDHFDKGAVGRYFSVFDKAFSENQAPWPHTMFNDSYEVYGADWTPTLPQEFEHRRGYSMKAYINKLIERDEQMVHDYRETLGDMLLENFTQQWTSWAHGHGMITRNQAHGSPANLLDLYAAVDIPEIEGFGLSEFGIKGLRKDPGMTKLNDSDYSMFKYAPSAAHVSGKKLVSSETFTWLTEHFRTSLSQMKPDLDLMFCAGVNQMYYHGTCYSPKDDPWPGWKFYASIDMSPTNSLWNDATDFNKYIERCQTFLQWGEPDNDILVYFPIHDLWKRNTKTLLLQFAIHNLGKLAPEFKASILELDRLGYDCDYISDRQLMETTTVKHGNTTSAADTYIKTKGGTAYKALLIPEGATLTQELRNKIDNLKAAGVKVINGNNAQALQLAAKAETMKTALGLNMIRRKNDNGYHYFIANLTPNDVDAYARLAVSWEDAKWYDPLTGKWFAVETDGNGAIRMNLRSGESLILETFTEGQLKAGHVNPQPNNAPIKLNKEVSRVMQKTLVKDTVFPLDNPWKLHFENSVPRVDKTFDLPRVQTWETLDDENVKVTMGTGIYETELKLTSTSLYYGTFAIDLGDVRETARVYVNDEFIGNAWCVPYILNFDGTLLHPGSNKIRIEVTNLPANRIADLDRKGVKWRKFDEINVVDINYKKTLYDGWKPVPSGLNSPVTIYMVK